MAPFLLFGLFAGMLLGIARFHRLALPIAAVGLAAITAVRLVLTDFHPVHHLAHEGRMLLNLGGLLLGFALLADCFERSHLPEKLTRVLPGGKRGAFLLLVLVAVASSFLDNIAAALIGGAAATALFQRKVHVGYIAAIVAASNAGGAGSVIGDTTTTMIWLAGVSPLDVAEAALGAAVAIAFFGFFAARQQDALQPLVRTTGATERVDYAYVGIVAVIIAGAIGANLALGFPALGVWAAILAGSFVRQPRWSVLPDAARGTCFLLCLVLSASMMPVESLPAATASTAFGLGLVSAFFDNIPLTALAIKQGGYDWGMLAYCVGYGGSMLWFGSSAGVAISGRFPAAKSARDWLVQGWHVAVGYVLGFLALLAVFGWHAEPAPPATDAPSSTVHSAEHD